MFFLAEGTSRDMVDKVLLSATIVAAFGSASKKSVPI
jgi:hypothetical protein